ncbi:8-oxo-dGTP diphosphatase [Candidatus Giovannonibacteria bacterium]|nr:8-oxo-dGTP diphosphatase [Candidatus Giovannonibacteria bacterium]
MKKILTLGIVHQHPRVLLGMKKRGFGAGRWNGFGGKVKEGESIETALKREFVEEAGILPLGVEKAGIIDFEFLGKPGILQVHVFRVGNFEGEPRESEEMRPRWFGADELPFDEMWSADRHWFGLFLKGKKFLGKVFFDENDNALRHDFWIVRGFEP